MKRIINFAAVAALIFAVALLFVTPTDYAFAQQKAKTSENGFVDNNGDGINDNAKDADGDGLPNGQDPDYVKNNPGKGQGSKGFVDEDGNGINDLAKDDDGDGIPNGKDADYVPPEDGSGQQVNKGRKTGQNNGAAAQGETFRSKAREQGKNQNKLKERNRPQGFVDENGNGLNNNAKDNDGDGIPNGQDPDYERQNPAKGKGRMGFVDDDGDGINDLALDDDGDGVPNGRDPDFVRVQDGSGRRMGNGSRSGSGTGDCDGTGPKGKTDRVGGRR